MKKKIAILSLLALCATSGMAQSYREQFEAFKKESAKTYNDFRNEINKKYADFIRQHWPEREVLPALEKPLEDKPVPPVFFPEEDLNKEYEGEALPYVKIPVVEPAPQPLPIIPIDAIPITKPIFALNGDKRLEVKPVDIDARPIVPWNATTINKPVIDAKPGEDLAVKPVDIDVRPIVPKDGTTINKPVIDGKQEDRGVAVKPIDIEVKPIPVEKFFAFKFWDTEGMVRLDENHRFKLKDCSNNSIADAWEHCSGDNYRNLIYDCLKLRETYQLCDWAYLNMLQDLSRAFFGGECNEATFLTAYLYCQSGYKMRMARSGEKLCLLVGSKEPIAGKGYLLIGGEKFYNLSDSKATKFSVCEVAFEKEQSLSLVVAQNPLFSVKETDTRDLVSKRYPEITATIKSNKNLLDFYETYPSIYNVEDDFMRRWAIYANTPLADDIKEDLYPALEKAVEGYPVKDAVNRLLNFVQTSLKYEYDDKVWGCDRAFFAEESLHYPFCDCEVRAILFSRIIRDILELEAVLVYYPGHLATAIHIPGNEKGDYVMLDGKRFTICDPAFIGANAGFSQPNVDKTQIRLVSLE